MSPPAGARAVTLSTFPFSDGFPWDEELVRSGRRAVSTHGVTVPPPTPDDASELRPVAEDASGPRGYLPPELEPS